MASYLDAGVEQGATLAVDGRQHPVTGGDAHGFWLGPSVLDHVTPRMSCYTDEIFGPVLSVVRAPSYEAAVDLVNGNPYGNGVAIFTNDGGAARRFESEVEVGMVGVNVPIPVPVAYYSLRRVEGVAVRRHARARHRRRALLHPRQGGHLTVARSRATAA